VLDQKSMASRCNATVATNSLLSITLHHGDLDILGSCLYDFEQTLDSQPDSIISREILLIVLLHEFSDGLRRSSDSGSLKDSWRKLL
jgi:hypothetical protein